MLGPRKTPSPEWNLHIRRLITRAKLNPRPFSGYAMGPILHYYMSVWKQQPHSVLLPIDCADVTLIDWRAWLDELFPGSSFSAEILNNGVYILLRTADPVKAYLVSHFLAGWVPTATRSDLDFLPRR